MPLQKVVSGGQTGADRGALEAALLLHFPYGGKCPKGRLAEDGTIPSRFDALAETESRDYAMRTGLNVKHSDATLIISSSPTLQGGTLLTRQMAEAAGKPWAHAVLGQETTSLISSASSGISMKPVRKSLVEKSLGGRRGDSTASMMFCTSGDATCDSLSLERDTGNITSAQTCATDCRAGILSTLKEHSRGNSLWTGSGGTFEEQPEDALKSLVNQLWQWLLLFHVDVLNIAGPRESEDPGIQELSKRLVMELLLDPKSQS